MRDDIRSAWRSIRRRPGIASVIVLTQALGLAALLAIVGLSDRILIEPLPFAASDRLVSFAQAPVSFGPKGVSVWPEVRLSSAVQAVGIYAAGAVNIGDENMSERSSAAVANAGFFDALAVPPLFGRCFEPGEDAGARVAVLSYGLWRRLFAGDSDTIHKSILINGKAFLVLGIMPEGFAFPGRTDVWIPPNSDDQITGGAFQPSAIARLRPTVGLPAAQQLLRSAYEAQIGEEGLSAIGGRVIVGLQDKLTRSARGILLVLNALVLLLMLLSAANVTALCSSRLRPRLAELAVRSAMGASRRRILRQLVVESLLLSAFAAVVANVAAYWAIGFCQRQIPSLAMSGMHASRFDLRFVVLGCVVSMISAALCALWPAWTLRSSDLVGRLREIHLASPRASRFTAMLTALQVANAFVLLSVTGAAISTLAKLQGVDLGFHTQTATLMEMTLPRARYPKQDAQLAFLDLLEIRIRARDPGIGVAFSDVTPGGGFYRLHTPLTLSDTPIPKGQPHSPRALVQRITSDYFRLMGIQIVAGRPFDSRDVAGGPRTVIVTESAARILSPADPGGVIGRLLPLGQTNWGGAQSSPSERAQIVGVVRDTRVDGANADPQPQVYRPIRQVGTATDLTMIIDAGDADRAYDVVSSAVRSLDANIPVHGVISVSNLASKFLLDQRMTAVVTSALSVVGLSLCALGLYGVLAQRVADQTREIGIRMALGAPRLGVRVRIIAIGLTFVAIGVAGGWLTSAVVIGALRSRVSWLSEPLTATLFVPVIVLLMVAIAACWLPAHRASSVDPLRTLRES